MPLGPFGEVVGTTGTLEALGPDASNYKSKVIAPRNPKLLKDRSVTSHRERVISITCDFLFWSFSRKRCNTNYDSFV